MHEIPIRFFHTGSRLSPMVEGPYGDKDRLLEEGVVLEFGACGAGQVCMMVRINERNGDSGSNGQ